jgi:hypothetical protein
VEDPLPRAKVALAARDSRRHCDYFDQGGILRQAGTIKTGDGRSKFVGKEPTDLERTTKGGLPWAIRRSSL